MRYYSCLRITKCKRTSNWRILNLEPILVYCNFRNHKYFLQFEVLYNVILNIKMYEKVVKMNTHPVATYHTTELSKKITLAKLVLIWTLITASEQSRDYFSTAAICQLLLCYQKWNGQLDYILELFPSQKHFERRTE